MSWELAKTKFHFMSIFYSPFIIYLIKIAEEFEKRIDVPLFDLKSLLLRINTLRLATKNKSNLFAL